MSWYPQPQRDSWEQLARGCHLFWRMSTHLHSPPVRILPWGESSLGCGGQLNTQQVTNDGALSQRGHLCPLFQDRAQSLVSESALISVKRWGAIPICKNCALAPRQICPVCYSATVWRVLCWGSPSSTRSRRKFGKIQLEACKKGEISRVMWLKGGSWSHRIFMQRRSPKVI